MQLTIIYALVALLPALAMTSPVSNDEITDVADNVLMKRGIDICPPEYRVAGGNCKFGSSKNDPHACGKNNPAVIVSLSSLSKTLKTVVSS